MGQCAFLFSFVEHASTQLRKPATGGMASQYLQIFERISRFWLSLSLKVSSSYESPNKLFIKANIFVTAGADKRNFSNGKRNNWFSTTNRSFKTVSRMP